MGACLSCGWARRRRPPSTSKCLVCKRRLRMRQVRGRRRRYWLRGLGQAKACHGRAWGACVVLPGRLRCPAQALHAAKPAIRFAGLPAVLSPEPARQGSELSVRINAVLRQLRGTKELWQVRVRGAPASAGRTTPSDNQAELPPNDCFQLRGPGSRAARPSHPAATRPWARRRVGSSGRGPPWRRISCPTLWRTVAPPPARWVTSSTCCSCRRWSCPSEGRGASTEGRLRLCALHPHRPALVVRPPLFACRTWQPCTFPA